jgi:hypothetical protein
MVYNIFCQPLIQKQQKTAEKGSLQENVLKLLRPGPAHKTEY